MAVKPLFEFVAELLTISINEAKSMVEDYEVSLNGKAIEDPTIILKSGDVVRADTGHLLSNSPYIAVVI